jgi:hypothetical protein
LWCNYSGNVPKKHHTVADLLAKPFSYFALVLLPAWPVSKIVMHENMPPRLDLYISKVQYEGCWCPRYARTYFLCKCMATKIFFLNLLFSSFPSLLYRGALYIMHKIFFSQKPSPAFCIGGFECASIIDLNTFWRQQYVLIVFQQINRFIFATFKFELLYITFWHFFRLFQLFELFYFHEVEKISKSLKNFR